MRFQERVADGILTQNLEALGAVLIEGIRGCGKTETARRAARSEVRLDVDTSAIRMVQIDPALILDGANPRLRPGFNRARPDVLPALHTSPGPGRRG